MVRNPVTIVLESGPVSAEVISLLTQHGIEAMETRPGDSLRDVVVSGRGDLIIVSVDQARDVVEQLEQLVFQGHERLPVLAICPKSTLEGLENARDIADDALAWPEGKPWLVRRVQSLFRQGMVRQEIEHRQNSAAVLQEIAETLTASAEYEDLLHDVLVRLIDVVGADSAHILVKSTDEKLLYILGSSEDPKAARLPVEASEYPAVLKVFDGADEVVEQHSSGDVEALWDLPLMWKGEVYGVLELGVNAQACSLPSVRDLVRQVSHIIGANLRGSDLYASLREQTRRRKMPTEESRQQIEMLQKYEEFFQRAFDGVVVLDRQHRILHINPAGEQITGYARRGLLGSKLTEIVASQDRELLSGFLEEMGHRGTGQSFDVALITTSEDPILVSVSPSGILGEGEVMVLSFRDVTEARALENELRSTNEFLERLIDSAVDGIVATDSNGQLILFNKGAERIFSMQSSDVVGRLYFEDLYPPGTAELVMEQLRNPEDGGIGRLKAVRQEILNDRQERVPVNMSANLLYEDGREMGIVGIISDLRERLLIEERLAQAQEKLLSTEKQALIAELAGTTAHELNQPLTSVMGYAELLKRRADKDETTHRAIDIILKEAERMAEIVRKIGKITRYETKTYVGETQILDLEKSSGE